MLLLGLDVYCILCIVLTVLYALLLGMYVAGWLSLPQWKPPANYEPATTISLLIPARNEENKIAASLQSVVSQRYPASLLEVVVIDDHSTDQTAQIVQTWAQQYPHIKLIRLQDILPQAEQLNAYKKKAIETAIGQTSGKLIVTTDADCFTQPLWLHTIAAFFETHHLQMIAAPVCFAQEQSFFERFQTLDFFGMMVSTGATLHWRLGAMCNGANLAYTRQAFNAVQGFKGIDHLASGDDMLLMAKIMLHYPNAVKFLKNAEATVYTTAQPTLSAFVNQRVRWASKSAQYQHKQTTLFLAIVFFFNLSILVNGVLLAVGKTAFLPLLLVQLLFKFIADWVYLYVGARFWGRGSLLWWFLPAQPLHLLYIVVIGLWGNVGKYTWKGRVVR